MKQTPHAELSTAIKAQAPTSEILPTQAGSSIPIRDLIYTVRGMQVMRAFVEMRHFLANNEVLFEQVRKVELKQLEYQRQTDERFQRVFAYMEANQTPSQKIFFDGQIYDAFELLVSLIQHAEKEIALVDGYVDTGTLNLLAKKQPKVHVDLWTRRHTVLTERDIATFNAQYPRLKLHTRRRRRCRKPKHVPTIPRNVSAPL